MSKIASFVVGAIAGAASMVGLAYWISEQEDPKPYISSEDQEAESGPQDQASQEDHAQAQEAGDGLDEAVPTA